MTPITKREVEETESAATGSRVHHRVARFHCHRGRLDRRLGTTTGEQSFTFSGLNCWLGRLGTIEDGHTDIKPKGPRKLNDELTVQMKFFY